MSSFCLHGLAAVVLALTATANDAMSQGRIEQKRTFRTIVGRELTNPDHLSNPRRVRIVANRLVVLDRRSDKLVAVFDAQTGALKRKYGRVGGGPGEFRVPWSVEAALQDTAFVWVYDAELRRLTLLNVLATEQGNDSAVKQIITLKSGVMITHLSWIRADRLVVLGFFTENARLALCDTVGQGCEYRGSVPATTPDAPWSVKQQSFLSCIASKPDRTRFAVGTQYADRLDIYSRDGSLVANAERPVGFDPVFTTAYPQGAPTMSLGPETRIGFVDLVATNERIFALYSGKLLGEGSSAAWYGEVVYAYDWTGKIQEAYRLSSPAVSIAASADGRLLFSLQHEPLPAVVRYEISATRK